MPIARYFMVVGSALVVLLLVAGWSLPEPPASFSDRPEIIERAVIRIRSERKWLEKVVLDTNQLMIPTPSVEVAPTEQLVERLPDEVTDQTGVDASVRPESGARPIDAHYKPARGKRRTARAFPSAHVARTRHRNEHPTLGMGEECCWWADSPAMSKAASRKRVARRDSWTGGHFPVAN